MNRSAVILAHNRPELLAQTVAAIGPQVDHVIVIDNASNPPIERDTLNGASSLYLLRVPDQPPNLAQLWRLGLDYACQLRLREHDGTILGPLRVAFLCDDSPPPEGWFAAVTAAMDVTGAAIGSSSPWGWGPVPVLKTQPDADIMGRMPGWAFILDPDSGVYPDTAMHWWWLDSDIDWQARKAGGMVQIGTHPVVNQRPNEYTNSKPELGARAGQDAAAFRAKWGYCPW